MKISRDKIWKMFGKRCAYCGCELQTSTGKHMHIDHVKPLVRLPGSKIQEHPERDTVENLFPSCPQCNNYKHSMSVAQFRDQIDFSIPRLYQTAPYRNAIRFGLVKEVGWDAKFYFEKFKP